MQSSMTLTRVRRCFCRSGCLAQEGLRTVDITSVRKEPMTDLSSPLHSETSTAKRALPKFMVLRGGTYYFKRKVPADVVPLLKSESKQIWKSLETIVFSEAVAKLSVQVENFEAMVGEARGQTAKKKSQALKPRGTGTTKYLLPEHIPALLKRFEYFMLETDDDERRAIGTQSDKASKRALRAERLAMLEGGLAQYKELAADDDYSEHEAVAQQLLTDERLIAPPGSLVRAELLRKLLYKDIELLKAQRDRLLGEERETPAAVPVAPRELPTLLDLHKEWRAAQSNTRTVQTYLHFVEVFESIHGALPVAAIGAEQVEKHIRQLAQNGVTRETVRNHVAGIATLLKAARRKHDVSAAESAFDDVSLGDVPERDSSLERRPYELTELRTLFSSKLYTEGYRPRGQGKEASYWAPLMGPFLGARLEEVAQLLVDDVMCINSAWVIRIADLDEDQNIKTKTSYRLVPLHQELYKCGFLAYVASVKLKGEKRLFPSLKNDNQHKRFGGSLGSWYGRYLDTIGLLDPRLDYHSFRFLFKQWCSRSGIENETRDALTGHWVDADPASRGYMRVEDRQYPLPILVAAMQRLRYDELDLAHLYVAAPMQDVDVLR